MSRPLTIGMDARPAVHPQAGGFKTYVSNLIDTLAEIDRVNDYRLYLDRSGLWSTLATNPRFRAEVLHARPRYVGTVVREQVWLPAAELMHRPDVMHFPCGTAPLWSPAPAVLTIHDALEHMPSSAADLSVGLKRRLMGHYNRYCQRLAARAAAAIITVSEHSRRDLVRYLGVAEDRVTVVPQAAGRSFRPDTGVREEEYPFILAIGSHDPRKNLRALIQAYAGLPAETIARFRLVLVWTHSHLRRELLQVAHQARVADRIESLFAPSDAELNRLYNAATVFVFPSLYEGFGLPPIEAMTCGTPVISSNTSALPEVLGDGALLVDPTSVVELARSLRRVLGDPDLRADLSRRGRARAAQFTWRQTATKTLAVYESTAALAQRRSTARSHRECASA